MNKHVYRADLKIERLKKHLKGQRIIKPIENKALQYLSAEQELENARLLARTALNAHPEKTFRDVAQRWESTMSEKLGQLNADFEVYFYLAKIDLSDASPELQYVVDKKLTDFERNGVILGKEKGERIAELKSKITTFGNRFERNIFTADTTVTIHIDSLAGLPPDWIESQSQDEQKLITIPINNPTMNMIMVNADKQHTRKIVASAFLNRSYPQNLSILNSLRTTRHQLARLLGYESWAHYAAEPMMAKSPDRIQEFLSTIEMFESSFQFKRPDSFHPFSFLPHLFIYSSNYYTYLWSEVIGRDLLTGFNRDNLFDSEVGRRYRKTILERSGTAPMEELIEEFLGRPYNTDAWQAWINGDKSGMANTNNTER